MHLASVNLKLVMNCKVKQALLPLKKCYMFSVEEAEIAFSRIVAIECKVNTNIHVHVGAYLPAENNIKMYKDLSHC